MWNQVLISIFTAFISATSCQNAESQDDGITTLPHASEGTSLFVGQNFLPVQTIAPRERGFPFPAIKPARELSSHNFQQIHRIPLPSRTPFATSSLDSLGMENSTHDSTELSTISIPQHFHNSTRIRSEKFDSADVSVSETMLIINESDNAMKSIENLTNITTNPSRDIDGTEEDKLIAEAVEIDPFAVESSSQSTSTDQFRIFRNDSESRIDQWINLPANNTFVDTLNTTAERVTLEEDSSAIQQSTIPVFELKSESEQQPELVTLINDSSVITSGTMSVQHKMISTDEDSSGKELEKNTSKILIEDAEGSLLKNSQTKNDQKRFSFTFHKKWHQP
ncbi:unnamed protein product [Thelazia callipaeda]|uniref:Uncharacterized protein n=1 Tax=Thelazia callipaeda TaxID=103827 RepID=A0A0N5CQ26_THECL|nr:unnamed protein product [Thelazia callipaeda]